MDVVRKFGLYIAAGVLLAAAGVFYVLVVSKAATQRSTEMEKIKSHADELRTHSRNVPNPKLVEVTQEAYGKEAQTLDACEKLFADQPRDCHRRRFFLAEDPTHPDYGKPCVGEVKWLERYEAAIENLHLMLERAGLSDWIVKDNPWGDTVPKQDQIQSAQEAYWFQKDLAEILTDGVEVEFAKLIKMLRAGAEGFPKGPADLVIDFNATRRGREVTTLDDSLRNLPLEKLRAVLEAIIINHEELDLPSIFNQYLSVHDYPWAKVLELTMDEEQRKFLSKVLPLNEPDLSYHQRFVDYVTELRSVRYRKDVAGLLSRRGFGEIANLMGDLGQENRERIRAELDRWDNTTRPAQAIAAIVSLRDEADYNLVRDNRKLNLAAVENLTFSQPVRETPEMRGGESGLRGRPPRGAGGAPEAGVGGMRPRDMGRSGVRGEIDGGMGGERNELAEVWTFNMRVKVELERLPVFQRRFMGNCWHYALDVKRIAPGEGGGELSGVRGGMPGAGRVSPRGRAAAGLEPAGRRRPAPTRGPETEFRPGDEISKTEVQSDRYVWVDCECKAYQYTKVKQKLNERGSRAKESGTSGRNPRTAEVGSGSR